MADPQGVVPRCYHCNALGHKKPKCPKLLSSRGGNTRNAKAGQAVEAQLRDLQAQVDGARVALADKAAELADLAADKVKQEEIARVEERERSDLLKAQGAQAAMAGAIRLGAARLGWKMALFYAWPTIVVSLLALCVCAHLRGLHAILLQPIRWVWSLWRARGNRVRFLGLLVLALLLQLPVLSALLFQLTCRQLLLMSAFFTALMATVSSIVFLAISMTGWTMQVVSTLRLLSSMRTSPSMMWIKEDGLFGSIVQIKDLRDDTASAVEMRHARDVLVKYSVIRPWWLLRVFFDFLRCSLVMVCSVILYLPFWDTVLARLETVEVVQFFKRWSVNVELHVSSGLVRQVNVARNTPTSLELKDVAAMVERAAANEGYTNVSSFETHCTANNLRLNSARYVSALHQQYVEEMQDMGF